MGWQVPRHYATPVPGNFNLDRAMDKRQNLDAKAKAAAPGSQERANIEAALEAQRQRVRNGKIATGNGRNLRDPGGIPSTAGDPRGGGDPVAPPGAMPPTGAPPSAGPVPPTTGGPYDGGGGGGAPGGVPDIGPAPERPGFEWSDPMGTQGSPASGGGMYKDLFDRATGGTIGNFDRAAGRLRERVDSMGAGALDQAKGARLSSGFANSGLSDQDRYQNQAASQQAYGQGLVDLESQFEGFRQQGLQTGLGAANGQQGAYDTYNGLNQLDLGQRRGLDSSDYQFRGGNLFDLFNSQEERGWKSGENAADRSFQSGEKAKDRALDKGLAGNKNDLDGFMTSIRELFGLPYGSRF